MNRPFEKCEKKTLFYKHFLALVKILEIFQLLFYNRQENIAKLIVNFISK